MTEQSDEWISAATALELTYQRTGQRLWRQILERARDGIFRARAKHYIVEGPTRNFYGEFHGPRKETRYTDHEIPPKFFWAASGAALEGEWITGDFSTWIDGKWSCKAYGVQFLKADILAMFPENSLAHGEQDTTPADPVKPVPMVVESKELERAYKKRVDEWPKDQKTPREIDDWRFLETFKPGIPRDRVRDIRRRLAPASWMERGPKKLRG